MQNSMVISQPQDLDQLLGKLTPEPEAIADGNDDSPKSVKPAEVQVFNMKKDLT